MKFSVVVPTYNRAAGLPACLDALCAQNYHAYELILSDDGSTDETPSVAARYPEVAFVRGDNRGPAAARNRGIRRATGDVVAFTDDDCRVPTDWLSRLADGYRRYPVVAGVGGYLDPPDAVVRSSILARYERFVTFRIYRQGMREVVGGLQDYPGGGTSNISYLKRVLDAVGGFDEWFPYAAAEDHDLRVRVQSLGHKLLHLPLRVEHLRTYSLASFVRQSITHGRGVMRWEMKARGTRTSRIRVAARVAKRVYQYPLNIARFASVPLATVHLLGNLCDARGQWLEWQKLAPE